MPKAKLAALWEAGLEARDPFIRRGRDAAEVSLPFLAPLYEGEFSAHQKEEYSQRFSARAGFGVSNLSSKMTIGAFPPTAPFIKHEPDLRVFLGELGGSKEEIDKLVQALGRRDRAIQGFLNGVGFRAEMFPMHQHLLVSGNYLLEQQADGAWEGLRLDQYQVKRGGRDQVLHILIREVVERAALPVEIRRKAGKQFSRKDTFTLYTIARRKPQAIGSTAPPKWEVHQELDGNQVEKARTVQDDMLPWIPCRMFKSRGEHYGRSFFDLVQGMVETLEGLTQNIVEDAAMLSRGLWGIDPASAVDITDFQTKETGDAIYVQGLANGSIQMIKGEKGADLQVANITRQEIDRELADIFLHFIPRDSERTTASEIETIVRQLNEALGGAFALHNKEVHLPLARKTIRRMISLGQLTPIGIIAGGAALPDQVARIRVVTGMDAIGRSRDEIALQSFVLDAAAGIGPDQVSTWIEPEDYLTRLAAAKGLDPEGMIRTREQVEEEIRAAQEAAVVERAAPQIAAQQQQGA